MKFIHAMLHCLVIHKVQKDKTLVAPQCRGQDMNDENLMKIVVWDFLQKLMCGFVELKSLS